MNDPMERRPRAGCVDFVLESTRQRIMSGRYRTGEKLPTEPQFQVEWGVSRSVVREAMKILESQGLVRIEQGRGTFVSEVDTAPLGQHLEWALLRGAPQRQENGEAALDEWDALLDVRFVMEVASAERAAQEATNSAIAAMQRAIAIMRGRPDDAVACGEADFDFHMAIANATRNPLWPMLLGSLHGLLKPCMELGHHGPRNALMTASEHEEIFKAVRDGHSIAAGEAMRQHLQSARRDFAIARGKRGLPFPAQPAQL